MVPEDRAKRSRSEVNEGNNSSTLSWQRIVGKLLFLLCRVTTMLMRLVFAKVDLTSRHKPFSVWKNKHIEMDDTVSEMMNELSDLESLRSFQLVSEPPSPTHSHAPSTTSSAMTNVEHYLTQYQIEKCGEPPLCQHGRACHLWITKKEGPNHGRVFWRCPENRANQCKTFVWCSYQPEWKEESPVRSRSQESATTYSSRTSKGRSTGTTSTSRPQRLNDPRTCPHTDTVKTGTNAFVIKERCRQCNTMVVDRKRTEEEIDEMHQKRTATSSTFSTPATIDAETEAELKAFLQWRQGRGQSSGSKSRPN
jgi:hypothetical protein